MDEYIAVFDSGIGGLTVLAACMRQLPEEKFLYFGDNGRAPYGGRTAEEICRFTSEGFARLAAYPLKGAVIACNTATAAAAAAIRARYPFPVVGLEPAVRPALASCAGKVLVLATRATLASARFAALARGKEDRILPREPAGLVGAIEANALVPERIGLAHYLPAEDCGAVVLGCTHYVFLRREISAFYGVPAFDGNEGAARRLASLLGEKGSLGHSAAQTNKCSKNWKKSAEKRVIFLGKAKNTNKCVYFARFLA